MGGSSVPIHAGPSITSRVRGTLQTCAKLASEPWPHHSIYSHSAPKELPKEIWSPAELDKLEEIFYCYPVPLENPGTLLCLHGTEVNQCNHCYPYKKQYSPVWSIALIEAATSSFVGLTKVEKIRLAELKTTCRVQTDYEPCTQNETRKDSKVSVLPAWDRPTLADLKSEHPINYSPGKPIRANKLYPADDVLLRERLGISLWRYHGEPASSPEAIVSLSDVMQQTEDIFIEAHEWEQAEISLSDVGKWNDWKELHPTSLWSADKWNLILGHSEDPIPAPEVKDWDDLSREQQKSAKYRTTESTASKKKAKIPTIGWPKDGWNDGISLPSRWKGAFYVHSSPNFKISTNDRWHVSPKFDNTRIGRGAKASEYSDVAPPAKRRVDPIYANIWSSMKGGASFGEPKGKPKGQRVFPEGVNHEGCGLWISSRPVNTGKQIQQTAVFRAILAGWLNYTPDDVLAKQFSKTENVIRQQRKRMFEACKRLNSTGAWIPPNTETEDYIVAGEAAYEPDVIEEDLAFEDFAELVTQRANRPKR